MALVFFRSAEWRAHQGLASCRTQTQVILSNSTSARKMRITSCKCRTHGFHHLSATGARSISSLLPYAHQQRHSKAAAAASSRGSNMGDNSSGASSNSGVFGLLQRWKEDTCKLREQLQALGLAGVVAYGLLNTLYYTVAFLFVWFNVANISVPAGLGAQATLRKAAEVFALVWAGSQVTKLARAGAALAFAPVVDRCLTWGVEKLKLKNKQQAFALVVVACLTLAAAVLGAVVAVHA